MPRRLMLVLSVLALTPVASALGHIEIAPQTAAAGSVTTFRITVPNERASADTVAVAIRLPDGVRDWTMFDRPGWTASVGRDGTRPVLRWSGGRITGGQTADFRFRVRLPEQVADPLVFPATQRYDNGEVDRWIEVGDSELPAPTVAVMGAPPADASRTPPHGWGAVQLALGTVALFAVIGAAATMGHRRRRRRRPVGDSADPEADADG